MSIKKQLIKSKDLYKVTWSVEKKTANGAESIVLSGDFNDWSLGSDTFEKQKNGSFKLIKELPKGKEYKFRYLIDGQTWVNEEHADGYVASGISSEMNCVLAL